MSTRKGPYGFRTSLRSCNVRHAQSEIANKSGHADRPTSWMILHKCERIEACALLALSELCDLCARVLCVYMRERRPGNGQDD